MADFVAVLRKTVGSLGDNTPEMREKVFDKARSTIEAKLRAIQPQPPAAVIERQRKALEDAIATVRADYAAPAVVTDADADDALESVLAALDQPVVASAPVAAPPVLSQPAAVVAPPMRKEPDEPRPIEQPAARPSFPDLATGERLAGDSTQAARARREEPAGRRRSWGGLVAALIVVLAAAGGGYVWWNSSDDAVPVAQMPALDGEAAATDQQPETTVPPVEQSAAQISDTEKQAVSQPEANAPGAEKFTQRLLPDGSEIDEGPAGSEPGVGEGSSIATSVQPSVAPEAASAPTDESSPETPQEIAAADQTSEPTSGLTSDQPAEQAQPTQAAAVTVGQRAIFYEERTSTTDGAAEMGSIAWSLVQESPGGDLPPEPAIRAEATIPGKDVQLRMTIRRNGDQTLPASHIVEMIFLTPDGFGGGGVASVSRIAFKETEQAAGSPLVGIPAKIADGFFLIALSDAPAETQANLNLLAHQSWLDIPIVYQSGQRALLSLEKGIPGERVFQEALQAWSAAENG